MNRLWQKLRVLSEHRVCWERGVKVKQGEKTQKSSKHHLSMCSEWIYMERHSAAAPSKVNSIKSWYSCLLRWLRPECMTERFSATKTLLFLIKCFVIQSLFMNLLYISQLLHFLFVVCDFSSKMCRLKMTPLMVTHMSRWSLVTFSDMFCRFTVLWNFFELFKVTFRMLLCCWQVCRQNMHIQ